MVPSAIDPGLKELDGKLTSILKVGSRFAEEEEEGGGGGGGEVAEEEGEEDDRKDDKDDNDADGGLIFSGIVRAELTNEECGGSGGLNTPANIDPASDDGGGGRGGGGGGGGGGEKAGRGWNLLSPFVSTSKQSVSFDADEAALKRYTFAINGKRKNSVETSGSSQFSTQVS